MYYIANLMKGEKGVMRKRNYQEAEIAIISFDETDIITTSSGQDDYKWVDKDGLDSWD